jgi:hypothetical protein
MTSQWQVLVVAAAAGRFAQTVTDDMTGYTPGLPTRVRGSQGCGMARR